MNEKLIQEVVEVEKQAQELLSVASREAEDLPSRAEAEAQRLVAEARAAAQAEATKILEGARSETQAAEIMAKAQDRIKRAELLGLKNFEQAVNYVLDRVRGGT